MNLAEEKFVEFINYKKDGTPVSVPVWIVGLDSGELAFSTGGNSYKVKRMKNNPRVELVPTNLRGKSNPTAPRFFGTARVSTEPEDIERVLLALRSKYGWRLQGVNSLQKIYNKFARPEKRINNIAILITLDSV